MCGKMRMEYCQCGVIANPLMISFGSLATEMRAANPHGREAARYYFWMRSVQ